ncbi:MAG: LLM class F420-dependent oxidoreductase [Myxococcota bacterium]|jgi:F420-dependent oxidoreductase-like protein|nr:LLM class F420-dependent oxidoreductase [Deltaproteobacteria bacterium]MCP4242229.1 LLM class F420-dependent oxidoreductase [bacterium]MDP6244005.1 LLM class F420-dependent oxidoreductase [Myxococcota bacterium]MDP7074393.1 LLM class F420-dependent oxidoreductase [Myxococcota bacterium]MDP7300547.1 LLM class F420-dependent oxidoreductase [Myxococcota bacterium]
MKLGLLVGYSPATMSVPMDLIKRVESMGFDSVWTAEAWGSDAVSPAAWMLAQTEKINVGTAIMQMPGRTPAMTAMTAMTLYALSGGRFILGLGPSGPQVVEGWHGVAYGRPLTRTREYISIIRKILAREEKLTHEGYHYQLPYRGEDATGLAKPLKSILHGDPALRILTASISPNGMECAGEVADGVFPIWMNPERFDLFEEPLEKGFAKAGGGKGLSDFEVCPFVTCLMADDVEQCRAPIKQNMALYIGGMGAREKNFYNDYAKRLGYEEAAIEIQDLYLDGKKEEAAAAVPDELVDDVALVGPEGRIRERLQAWKEAGKKGHLGSMLIGGGGPALEVLAEEIL